MQKEYDLSLPVAEAKKPLVLSDLLSVETFLRLNPHWIIESVTDAGGSFEAGIKDHVTEKKISIKGTITATAPGRLVIIMDHDAYKTIEIFTTKEELMGIVTYGCTEDDLTEDVERHVVLWLRSVKEYLRMYLKDSLNAKIFRFMMNRIILKMTPSQRKISLMLIRITVVEIFVILLIVVGYVIFVLK